MGRASRGVLRGDDESKTLARGRLDAGARDLRNSSYPSAHRHTLTGQTQRANASVPMMHGVHINGPERLKTRQRAGATWFTLKRLATSLTSACSPSRNATMSLTSASVYVGFCTRRRGGDRAIIGVIVLLAYLTSALVLTETISVSAHPSGVKARPRAIADASGLPSDAWGDASSMRAQVTLHEGLRRCGGGEDKAS